MKLKVWWMGHWPQQREPDMVVGALHTVRITHHPGCVFVGAEGDKGHVFSGKFAHVEIVEDRDDADENE